MWFLLHILYYIHSFLCSTLKMLGLAGYTSCVTHKCCACSLTWCDDVAMFNCQPSLKCLELATTEESAQFLDSIYLDIYIGIKPKLTHNVTSILSTSPSSENQVCFLYFWKETKWSDQARGGQELSIIIFYYIIIIMVSCQNAWHNIRWLSVTRN